MKVKSTNPLLVDIQPKVLKIEIMDDDIPYLFMIPPQDLELFSESKDKIKELDPLDFLDNHIHLSINESNLEEGKCIVLD